MSSRDIKKWKKLEKRISSVLPPCSDYTFVGDVYKKRYTLVITYKIK